MMRILLIACCLAAGCTPTARFTITDTPVTSEPFVGFGGEMNPYLFARPNWAEPTYPATQPAQAAVNEQNVVDLERKVIELAPQHVRIFTLLSWWTPSGDFEIAKGDPRMVESFLRTVRLAQRAGAMVNLTLWYGERPWHEDSPRKFAQLVAKLIRVENLTCIQYLTIQNEPNDFKMKFSRYAPLYRTLDDELRTLGIRDRVKIISGDLVADNQEQWFHDIATNLADVSDGYSIHAYWNYWDTQRLVWRLTGARKIVDSLPPDTRRPLYVTEFGVRGRRPRNDVEPGWFDNGTPVADDPRQAVQIAWFDLLALNLGYVAALQWEIYDAWYDRLMPYGVIGDATTGYKLKPAYYVMQILTHTVKPGWQAVRVDGERSDVIVSAMRGPNGEFTVFALNHAQRAVRVNLTGLPSNLEFNILRWSGGAIERGGSFTTPQIEVTLQPQTLCALTNSQWSPQP